jgi:hypothetical protein
MGDGQRATSVVYGHADEGTPRAPGTEHTSKAWGTSSMVAMKGKAFSFMRNRPKKYSLYKFAIQNMSWGLT